jgi:hypothetical protein
LEKHHKLIMKPTLGPESLRCEKLLVRPTALGAARELVKVGERHR